MNQAALNMIHVLHPYQAAQMPMLQAAIITAQKYAANLQMKHPH